MKICTLCPHNCKLENHQTGFCNARKNVDDVIICINYGKVTSIALDPIEKKPLYHFYPNKKILSVGSFGCNLSCSFCQNYEISMQGKEQNRILEITPDELVNKAAELIPQQNIGIAFTYNEPVIGYEFVYDTAKTAHAKGLKTVLVTNGYIEPEPLNELVPYIDAMNIDLKGFTESFYKKISGKLDSVMKTIEIASKKCHVEVTTLIIPGENDSPNEIANLSAWLSTIDQNIPYHLSRFFPRYKMLDKQATDVNSIYALADIARKRLKYVYEGNIS